MDTIRSIINGIKKLFYWLPVIWQDHNFDWWYLAKIISHKLSAMEIYFRDHGCAEDHIKVADEIKWVRLELQKTIDNVYEETAWKDFHEIYGEAEHSVKNGKFLVTYPNDTSGHTPEQRARTHVELYEKYNQEQQKDLDFLFRLMAKGLRDWWD